MFYFDEKTPIIDVDLKIIAAILGQSRAPN